VLSKPIPRWLIFSAFTLAWAAGSINAVGFLGIHRGLSHMSGSVTLLGNALALGSRSQAWDILAVVASFVAGCALSAFILRDGLLQLGRSYGVVLVLESFCVCVSWWLFKRGSFGGECLAATACGLQNAMVSSYSGAVIRTTHVTGIITDLGISLGQVLRGQRIDLRRAGLYSVLLGGFFAGGVCGSLGFDWMGYNALLVPAAVTAAGGLSYFAYVTARSRS
jgi:uncharacterized membrane protein YoaK (UPF0700 family)